MYGNRAGDHGSCFSSACAHCFLHGVKSCSSWRHFTRRKSCLCAFTYYYPRNANHIFRREIFRLRFRACAAFAVSPLALSRSLADSVFKEQPQFWSAVQLSLSGLASLATFHAFQCKRITSIPANTPIYSGTHPLNNSKCVEMGRNGRTGGHARQMDELTRSHAVEDSARRTPRPCTRHASRTPTHAHTRQRMHTRTRTRTHAHTHTGGRTRTRTRTHPRTRRGPRARAHARPRTGGTSRAAPSAMQTRPL